jgi:hypothetical protein
LLAKPVVDGLERDLEGQAVLFRVERSTDLARELSGRHGLKQLPALVILDGQGNAAQVQQGRVDPASAREVVADIWSKSGGLACPATPAPSCQGP